MRFHPWLLSILCLAALAGQVFADEPARPLGRYTFMLGEGGGCEAGVGTFTVNARGAVRGVVRLHSGLVLSAGGHLREDGAWPLLATGQGDALEGAIIFPAAGRCAGLLEWRRASNSTPVKVLQVNGESYDGTAGFFADRSHGTMRVRIEGRAGTAAIFAENARMTPQGVFYQMTPGPRLFSLRFQPATGLITGRLRDETGQSRAVCAVKLAYHAVGFVGYMSGRAGGWFTVRDAFLEFGGGGTTTSNTYTGTTTVNGGTLQLNTGSVVKTGAGTLTLAGTNTFTGNTTITGGTLVINGGSSTVNGGTLTLSGGITNTWSTNNPSAGTNWLNNVFIRNPGIPVTPIITPGGSVTTTGAGTLTLTGTNTYTGTTTVSGGTLTLGNNATIGGTLNVTRANLLNHAGNISIGNSGTGGLTLATGWHQITFPSPGTSTFASGFRVTNEAGETIALADAADGQIIFINGARYRATRPASEGPITLVFAPILIAE